MRLRTFGGLSLTKDGHRVDGSASQRKKLTLLAFLAAESPAGVSRDKLLALLWPESEPERARGALNQALSSLRVVVGADAIASGPVGDVRLDSNVVTSDVAEFRAALEQNDLEGAIAVYNGPFLDGIFLRDAPEFERWLEMTRAHLASRYHGALERLAAAAEARGDAAAEASLVQRLAEGDPLSSRIALRLMRSLVRRGEREAALSHGKLHTALVREELGADPDPAIASFIRELLTTPADARVVRHNLDSAEADLASPLVERSVEQRIRLREVGPTQRLDDARRRTSRGRKARIAAAAFGVTTLVATPAVARLWPARDVEPLVVNARRVVVDEFENRTGDKSLEPLGAMLADWITRGLQQTGVVDVVDPESRLALARRLATGKESSSRIARSAEVAREAGAGTVVSGAIYKQAGVLRYSATITDVSSGKVLASLDPILAPSSNAVGGADELRDRVAGALAAALDTRTPTLSGPGNRPPSFAAYREYMRGMEAFQADNYALALQHFDVAARLDSSFSSPLVWKHFALQNAGRGRNELEEVVAALARRRETLAPLDLLALEYFEADLRGDVAAANEALYAAARVSPGSAWGFMAGQAADENDQPAEALQYLQRIDPEHGWVGGWSTYWQHLTQAYHVLARYEEELAAVRRWRALDPHNVMLPYFEGRALVAAGHRKEAARTLGDATFPASGDDAPGDLLWKMGLEYRVHGADSAAKVAFEKSLSWFRSPEANAWHDINVSDPAERRLTIQVRIGKLLYELGRWDEAQRTLAAVRGRKPSEASARAELPGILGLLAARRGDVAAATRWRSALDRLATQENDLWATMASAEISEQLGESGRAIERLGTVWSGHGPRLINVHRFFEILGARTNPRFIEIARPKG